MANLIMVLGDTGAGKSTGIKTLDPKKTFCIKALNKDLPFKGSRGMYNVANKNVICTTNYSVVTNMLNRINTEATFKDVNTIVIDDATYFLRQEYADSINQAGFKKFTSMAINFNNIINTINSLKEDLTVFLILHSEVVQISEEASVYKFASVGKLLDTQFNPLHNVNICLFAKPKFVEDKVVYGFYTNKTCIDGIEVPAKSPDGIFDEGFIPNDYEEIRKKVIEYYEG